jgi:hypothetical protein
MSHITHILNRYFKKMAWPFFKYSMVFFFSITVITVLLNSVVVPQVTKRVKKGDVKILTALDGTKKTIYGDKSTPKSYEEEMKIGAPQLIYQNQERYYRHHDGGASEDQEVEPAVLEGDRAAIIATVRNFLSAWETFSASESLESYQSRLRPHVNPNSLEALADRKDNRQPAAIGIGAENGSKAYRPGLYAQALTILRYDKGSAYVSLLGATDYTGPGFVWAGKSMRRAYGIVLTKVQGEWKVSRAAAQTLGPAQHITPN